MAKVVKLLLIYLAIEFLVTFVMKMCHLTVDSIFNDLASDITLDGFSTIISGVLFIAYLTYSKNLNFSDGFSKPSNNRAWALSVLSILSFIVFMTTLEERVFYFLPDILKDLYPEISCNLFLLFVVVIFAPVFEEVVFRRVFLGILLEKHKPMTAILISALIFGVIHINPAQVVFAFIAGLLLGYIYYKTRNIYICMTMHFINNFLFALSIIKHGSDYNQTDIYPNTISEIVAVCLSVVMFFVCVRAISRLVKVES